MKTVAFLCQNLTGHLNPTVKLAQYYQKEGFEIFYGSTHDTLAFTQKNGFNFYPLNSLPFAIGLEDILHENQQEKWLESLVDRHTDKLYNLRKKEIERLIEDLNPDLIFLDEFNYSDFILLYPFLEKRKLVILQTKFPMYYNKEVPPLNTFAFPSKEAERLWKRHFRKRNWLFFWDYLKFFGKNDLDLLRRKFKLQAIPETFQINDKKVFKPTFNNVEEWFLVPQEFNFKEQILLPWQRYFGPLIDLNRNENIESIYLNFIEKKEAFENNKLIYCSLGTALTAHLRHNKRGIDSFFNNLIDIANENPNLYFVIKLERELSSNFKSKSKNLLFLNYAPQMEILKKADIFLTHSGAGSVFESIFCNTPMLLFPLNDKWDQNGMAARVVHQSMGIKAELNDPKIKIAEAIQTILTQEKYKENVLRFSEIFRENYGGDFLEKIFSTELLVQ